MPARSCRRVHGTERRLRTGPDVTHHSLARSHRTPQNVTGTLLLSGCKAHEEKGIRGKPLKLSKLKKIL